ncbi:hypothetical protein LTR15_002502 [Elasticomyces elasticus]|nr:hypothetical protein LTR15_002502 [Elasticomyces elasticus]
MARSFIPPGASQGSEEALAELRESIDSVKAAHQEERNVDTDEPLPPPVKQDPARRDGLEYLRVIRDVAKSKDADQQQQQAEKPRWTKQAPVTEPEPLYHPRHRPLSHMYS